MRDWKIISTKERKEHPWSGYDASTDEVAFGKVGRDEQGEARRANTTQNVRPHLELGRLRPKIWSKSDFSIAETTGLTYQYISIIVLYRDRNVVFYCLFVKANNATSSCQLLLWFCGRFERSGVQASCRAPNSIYQTRRPSHRCSGAGGVFSSWWRCVSVVTQRKVWTSLSKKSSKTSFFNQARWSRRPFLVISTVINNDFFPKDPCPILVCLRNHRLTNVFICLRVGTLNRLSSTLEQRLRISSALILHFFLSAVYITRKLGENDDVFQPRDRDFLNPQNPNFSSF